MLKYYYQKLIISILKGMKDEYNILSPSEFSFSKNQKALWFDNKEYFNKFKIPGLNNKTPPISPILVSEIIKDKIPILSLISAMEMNYKLFINKNILVINNQDLGIFSLISAKLGAKKVYCIEPNNSFYVYQKQIVKDNKYENIIEVINSSIYDINSNDFDVEMDIIICNWSGDFLIHNSLVKEVIYARDTFMKKNGFIFPDYAVLYFSGIENVNYKLNTINAWDNIYGINMSCLKQESICDPINHFVKKEKIISTKCPIFEIDMYTIDENKLNFSNEYLFVIDKDDDLSGFITWFDVKFKKTPNTIKYTTSPFGTKTKWNQVSFYIDKDIRVDKEDIVFGSISCRVNEDLEDLDGLDIKISYNVQRNKEKLIHGILLYKLK